MTSPDGDTGVERLADGERLLGWLLDASHHAAPDDVPDLLVTAARRLGATDAQLYLAEVDQRLLVPVPSRRADDTPLRIDGTLAGRAYQTGLRAGAEASEGHVWLPVVNGSDRLGVIRLEVEAFDEVTATIARHLASLVADIVVTKSAYGDLFRLVRRRKQVGLAAEMQWHLLPPLTFTTPRVSVAGILEPAYEVAGDAFDYALNGDELSVAIFDGVGHDLASSLMTTLAVASYRHARRRGLGLVETAAEVDDALGSQFGIESYVTASMGRLDLATGSMAWLNAGHPRPLLLRGGHVVRSLACRPRPPLGVTGVGVDVDVAVEQLEPGDAVLWFTDGLVEARSAAGAAFGFDRLAEFLQKAGAARLAPAETMRRLLHAVVDYHGGGLQDDATTLLMAWQSPS